MKACVSTREVRRARLCAGAPAFHFDLQLGAYRCVTLANNARIALCIAAAHLRLHLLKGQGAAFSRVHREAVALELVLQEPPRRQRVVHHLIKTAQWTRAMERSNHLGKHAGF